MTRYLVAALLLVTPIVSYARGPACSLPQQTLEIAGTPTATPTEKRYRRFFDDLERAGRSADRLAIDRCCKDMENLPAKNLPCTLVRFRAGQLGPERLTATVPITRAESEWLWKWDIVVQRTGGKDNHPSGFASSYIDEVLGALSHQPRHFRRLFELYRFSDGEYAQYIGEKLVRFLGAHPQVVLDLGDEMMRNLDGMERALDLFPDERPALAAQYRRECSRTSHPSCQRWLNFLDGK